jgi:hypothetical protein
LVSSSKLPSDVCSEIEQPELSAVYSTLLVPILSIRAALPLLSIHAYNRFSAQCLVTGKIFILRELVF